MESDFKQTRIYELMQRSNAASEAHRQRDEREWKHDQRGTSTPAAAPHNGHPGDKATDRVTVANLSQVFCSELVIGTLAID